jgi:Rrf2 family nitric oxide-sensitive transcriptional repressor
MRLTQFTDYSLRVLIYLALQPEKLTTINQLTDAYGVSRHHIRSVVHHLAKLGYINSTQGKGGGLTLALKPEEISLREIVEKTENDFFIVECFKPGNNSGNNDCPIEPICVLKQALSNASNQFLVALEKYTIEDLIKNKKKPLSGLLNIY